MRLTLVALVVLFAGCNTNLSRRAMGAVDGQEIDAGRADASFATDGARAEADAAVTPDAAPPPAECEGMACPHHASCVVELGTPRCTCDIGFHAAGAACEPDAGTDPCAGITCSGHGFCTAAGAGVSCTCAAGYEAHGLSCDPIARVDPCSGITCAGHGSCSAVGGIAVCACEGGYVADGASCVPEASATVCGGVTCGGHGVCFADSRGRPSCRCDSGYYGSDATACVPMGDGSRCDGVSCGAGSCVLRFTGFGVDPFCNCPPGYQDHGLGCMRIARTHCTTFDGTLRERGEFRCSAGDDAAEVCRDDDGDGLVEWSFVESCGGVCSATDCATHAGECHDSSECPTGSICITGDHGEAWPIGRCFGTCDCSNCGTCDTSDFTSYGTRYCGAPLESTTATMACREPCPGAQGCIPLGSGSVCWPVEGCYDSGDPS